MSTTSKEIMDILKFLKTSGLNEVEIKTKVYEIKIKRKPEQNLVQQQNAHAPLLLTSPNINTPPSNMVNDREGVEEVSTEYNKKTSTPKENAFVELNSPMIGTFYRSQNPETPPFIEVGQLVEKGKTICIIEAMKLFNEIEAEHSGKIVKILVNDSTPVEFGQPLFLIDPQS